MQNRIKRIEPRLPEAVRQEGIQITEASSAILQFITLTSTVDSLDEVGLGDIATRYVLPEIRRLPGVGRARLFSTERAMRVWLDPDKLLGLGLTAQDVNAAIAAQNAQVASGLLGAPPSPSQQRVQNMVLVKGQLESPGRVRRHRAEGQSERRDGAAARCGPSGSGRPILLLRNPPQRPPRGVGRRAVGADRQRAGDRGCREGEGCRARKILPPRVKYEVSYDVTPVIKASVKKVLLTLAEAVALVFVVMFLFLQNIRYTLIPTIVVPIALLGTCAALLAMGFSINVLTMFGMVLAIGILVDDAIVVVENVERIMAEEGLGPREATQQGHGARSPVR